MYNSFQFWFYCYIVIDEKIDYQLLENCSINVTAHTDTKQTAQKVYLVNYYFDSRLLQCKLHLVLDGAISNRDEKGLMAFYVICC